MNQFYKYIFVSHSSKDWNKVRLIRNFIEKKNFYPLLFHLKCLEKEPLTPRNSRRLKKILSDEIASRGRFLLCSSKKSLQSEFVKWEVREVKKHSNIIMKEIDLENPMSVIKEELKEWTSKLSTIAFISTWRGRMLRNKLSERLLEFDNSINIVDIEDDDHLLCFSGLPTGAVDYVHKMRKVLDSASIMVSLVTRDYYDRCFCSYAESYISNEHNIVLQIDLKDTPDEHLGLLYNEQKKKYESCSINDELIDSIFDKIIKVIYR